MSAHDHRPARRTPIAAAPPQAAPPLRWLPALLRNPWGEPRFLVATTWLYIAWALVPVLIAILFSFNAGRSRSVWQGFSIRWWWGDPTQSVFHDPAYSTRSCTASSWPRSTW